MQSKLKKMFSVFEIIALEHVAGISLSYEENTSDQRWTCYQGVLRFQIWIKNNFSTSISLCLMENLGESAAVFISVFVGTSKYVDSWKEF